MDNSSEIVDWIEVEFPETVIGWHWEYLREESDDLLTASRDIPAPIILFIKYVLGHTECYPKEVQPKESESNFWDTPKMWLDDYSIYKPFKIEREKVLELAKFLPYIKWSDKSYIWLGAESKDSEDVEIFFCSKNLMDLSKKSWYNDIAAYFLEKNELWYFSTEKLWEFIPYNKEKVGSEVTVNSNDVHTVMTKK